MYYFFSYGFVARQIYTEILSLMAARQMALFTLDHPGTNEIYRALKTTLSTFIPRKHRPKRRGCPK
jgi:hypothetical protein